MTDCAIESVARAFYDAECDDDWGSASDAERELYRDLAQSAIVLLKRQLTLVEDHPSSQRASTRIQATGLFLQ